MTQELLVFFSGILLFLIPFFGIPTDWKLHAMSGLGVLLIVVGYRLRYRRAIRDIESTRTSPEDGFVEATKPLFTNPPNDESA